MKRLFKLITATAIFCLSFGYATNAWCIITESQWETLISTITNAITSSNSSSSSLNLTTFLKRLNEARLTDDELSKISYIPRGDQMY